MKGDLGKSKKHAMLLMLLIVMAACNPSEYYQKEGMSEISLPNPGDGTDVTVTPPNPTDPTGPVDPGPTDPGTTTPPVVVNPPTKPTDPVEPTNPSVVLNDKVERFTQNVAQTHPVDILWVIDDSGSMANEQDALAANFESFINQFLVKDIDFRMGITTTDGTSTKNGKMVGDSSKLTSAAALANKSQFLSNFKTWVKVGTRGSGKEQGLQTSENFISRYEASFLRKDAVLAVVYLTDEEDQSPKTVASYLSSLQATKENKAHVKAYSIITVREKANREETWGSRYEEISKLTAGVVSDIKKDFSSTLLNIGEEIVTLLDSFALNESPYQDKVRVYVNGNEVVDGWTFNVQQRSVSFDKGHLPAEGSKVEIHYQVQAKVLGAI